MSSVPPVTTERTRRTVIQSGEFAYFLYFVRSSPLFLVGLVIVTVSIILALIGPYITPYPPEASDAAQFLQPPSSRHFFGTDNTGMDIFSRVLAAPRVDVVIAIAGSGLGLVGGVLLGSWAGFFGGRGGWAGAASEGLLRVMDIIQSFPVFIFALALVAAMGPSATNVIIALGFLQLPVILRLTRSAVLDTREKPYIEAARCVANPNLRIVFRHIMPNSLAPALIQASVHVGWAVLLTASLSFVGAGVRPPTPEWGSMISIGASNMTTGQWWPALFPGVALGIAVLGFALVGDGLRHYLDPAKRR